MNQAKAFGSFVLRHGKTFRTSAYMQWGKSKKSLGAALMLNPGSAHPNKLNPDLDARLKTLGAAMGRIQPDPTMDQLIRLIEKIHNDHPMIEGRFQIFNLFNLQETNAETAIDTFESLVDSHKITVTESLVTPGELQVHPWILLGWGVNHRRGWRHLREIKDLWLQQIEASGIPKFGKMNKNGDYYHPCPQVVSERPIMLDELFNQYSKAIKPLLPAEKPIQLKNYSLLRWNRKQGREAQAILRDNRTGLQCLFTPGLSQNLIWFHCNLANDLSLSDWKPFDDRSFDDLSFIDFKEEKE
ncbi:DUF1643 domain-containing protein [Sporolactobacillus putidus]|uniref:DUF1643 domain-containing protein n=1 Tax=Sporolactobacillus putidus TaxID=492735 RepID=A0A917S1A9_9BACL|nr:DUF1643 domain-containing protein [Sporolactobacillus putidus]GGL51551.1 hypothetical protein GCM10007968_14600 [Sporolactobacillus putidus]